jgi:hypothetical protein
MDSTVLCNNATACELEPLRQNSANEHESEVQGSYTFSLAGWGMPTERPEANAFLSPTWQSLWVAALPLKCIMCGILMDKLHLQYRLKPATNTADI